MSSRLPPRRRWSWRSRSARGLLYQAVALLAIVAVLAFLAYNTRENMQVRGIHSGFDFLHSTAGFDIGDSPIEYSPGESYGRAIWVGVLNTLRVAALGMALTTVLGVLLGVGRFSRNALLRGLCYGYVELLRNVPILLQMLMWYLLLVELLPPPNRAWSLAELFYLSKDGFAFPRPLADSGYAWALLGAVAGALAGWWGWRRRGGQRMAPALGLLAGAAAGWLLGGMPGQWSRPEKLAFMIDGGGNLSPEFLAVLIGLTTYTAAFVAEVVRAGVQSVERGQREAAAVLGLSPRQSMRLVVLPQAMRVIVPSLTNQYLNLTKNSSLAVAVGYPDVVSIANTTLNQTGRAVECVAIIMLVYLATSLSTALLMNVYNRRAALRER